MRRTRSLARLLLTIATAGVWVGWLEARSGAVTSIHAASQPPASTLSAAWAALLGDWKGEGGGAPQYRLTYTMLGPNRLGVSFEVAPPGGPFKTYVTGVNTRVSTPW